MAKRLLDTTARDLAGYSRTEKLAAIRGSEGRTVAAEVICSAMALLHDVSNPELAASQGADLIILNVLDVTSPAVHAVAADSPDEVVRTIKRLTGRLVAVNLEPVDPEADLITYDQFVDTATTGRLATPDNARRAAALGVDAIVLTGNPGMGVTNAALARAIGATRDAVGSQIIIVAGKMHAAGSASEAGAHIIDDLTIAQFVAAGADVILLPAPGTVPGCHEAQVRGWVEAAHRAGALTMTAIGTSQEGADVDTIRALALMAKMTGTDIHHLGDCGYFGITLPENLVAYSMAIRGRRHTYRRMAMSLLR
jgi:putative N-acetylmannosamine-6-phosphate epimerase